MNNNPQLADILLLGPSGVGKSTLINAVLGNEQAHTSTFREGGDTQEITVFQSDDLGYRLIDTKGMEPNWIQQMDTMHNIKKYINGLIKKGNPDAAIEVIWYCLNSFGDRVFEKELDPIKRVCKSFPGIPVVVVLTKSLAPQEIEEQKEIVLKRIFAEYEEKGRFSISDVISVNSLAFTTRSGELIPIYGVDRLIETTNTLVPEATKLAMQGYNQAFIKLKAKWAYTEIVACTLAAAAVAGTTLVPVADSAVLVPIQTGMTKGIASLYKMGNVATISGAIYEGAAISVVAKNIAGMIKALPGLPEKITAQVINAIVAGVFTFAVGTATDILCRKIINGEIDKNDLDSIKEFIGAKVNPMVDKLMPGIAEALEKNNNAPIDANFAKMIVGNVIKQFVVNENKTK